jgi:hypothetical protein
MPPITEKEEEKLARVLKAHKIKLFSLYFYTFLHCNVLFSWYNKKACGSL